MIRQYSGIDYSIIPSVGTTSGAAYRFMDKVAAQLQKLGWFTQKINAGMTAIAELAIYHGLKIHINEIGYIFYDPEVGIPPGSDGYTAIPIIGSKDATLQQIPHQHVSSGAIIVDSDPGKKSWETATINSFAFGGEVDSEGYYRSSGGGWCLSPNNKEFDVGSLLIMTHQGYISNSIDVYIYALYQVPDDFYTVEQNAAFISKMSLNFNPGSQYTLLANEKEMFLFDQYSLDSFLMGGHFAPHKNTFCLGMAGANFFGAVGDGSNLRKGLSAIGSGFTLLCDYGNLNQALVFGPQFSLPTYSTADNVVDLSGQKLAGLDIKYESGRSLICESMISVGTTPGDRIFGYIWDSFVVPEYQPRDSIVNFRNELLIEKPCYCLCSQHGNANNATGSVWLILRDASPNVL